MNILTINAGSSSLKVKVFRVDVEILSLHIDGIGKHGVCNIAQGSSTRTQEHNVQTHQEAIDYALKVVAHVTHSEEISACLHRVVHGGEEYPHHSAINNAVEAGIEKLSLLAPLHNPVNLAGIKAARKALPHATHVAFFDTAFHHTIPRHAFLYGIPYSLYKQWGIRKYGFHGLSHQHISDEVYTKTHKDDRIVSCHLGSGCSVAAMHHGKSLDTTMGFTPLDGLLMATRSGELDPEIPLFLQKRAGMTVDQVDQLLNKEAGIRGIVGTGDLREVKRRADEGDARAKLVIDMFCYRVSQAVGSYHITVGGMHTLVFTGGIGEHAPYVREAVCKQLAPVGVLLDPYANEKNATIISQPSSRVTVMVIPANEELHMVRLFLAKHYMNV